MAEGDAVRRAGGRVSFVCNICGGSNECDYAELRREAPTCTQCKSSVRSRAIVHVLSRELFSRDLPFTDFPRLKSIRILGISDSEDYASRLGSVFDYRNTFYHEAPRFDIRQPGRADPGAYDFVICSEVLEHVTPPVEEAFRNIRELLKDHGVLILTVPYTIGGRTKEHFPELHDYALARLSERTVLVNRTPSGELQVFDDLVFHGGHGETLELRVFSEPALRATLAGAGFNDVEVYASEHLPSGIALHEAWSLPMAARRNGRYVLEQETARELANQWCELRGELARTTAELERRTDWARALDRKVKELEPELEKRTEWALALQAQLEERTTWAAQLKADLDAARARVAEVEREFDERSKWALTLDSELKDIRAAKAQMEGELSELKRRHGRIRRRLRRLFGA